MTNQFENLSFLDKQILRPGRNIIFSQININVGLFTYINFKINFINWYS